ncbi:cytochrome c oxidase subunit 6b-1 isoform X2 [Orussus abietinus]|uniref:cytochrome c oxidase subunit 6b-1 isoform X2 n=1 Tax=Orussus abietinus TaxID=222816 RepID=UPI000625D536|nr:cytochrome c oxidase subunit 6b-1 isoform X2 [Orussus abietinus]
MPIKEDDPNYRSRITECFPESEPIKVEKTCETDHEYSEDTSNEVKNIISNDNVNNQNKLKLDEVSKVTDDDDPCKKARDEKKGPTTFTTAGRDPRFQQQNQTLRCFVMYTDFHRCEHLLGTGHEACTWFKQVFTSICPISWVERWDWYRSEGRMPWSRAREQGKFPGNRYGD